MTRRRWIVAGVLGTLLATVAGLVFAYPAVAAVACPRCYGLEPVAENVYADSDVTAVIAEANARVERFYGGRKTSPRVLACATDDCYHRIGGGGERGIAVLNRAVMLSPRGLDPVIASHEMAHVEFHGRLDSSDGVPQWFDEGLAVVVSDDARYLLPASAADRCRVEPDGPLPASLGDWLAAASADQRTYAKAACRVSRWLGSNGGSQAVLDLVDDLNAGRPFPAI